MLSHFSYLGRFFNKKTTTFKNMSLQFSLNSSKYVHSWTLAVNKILILIKFPFQRYISCRHLTFDPTYEIGCHGNFPPFRKSGILALVDYFGVCTIIFLKFIGRYKNVKQDFFWTQKFLTDSITGLGLWRITDDTKNISVIYCLPYDPKHLSISALVSLK